MFRLKTGVLLFLIAAISCGRDPVTLEMIEAAGAHEQRLEHAETLGTWLVGEFETEEAGTAVPGAPATLRVLRLPQFGRGFYAEAWCTGDPDQTLFQEVLIPVVEGGNIRLQRWRLPRAEMYTHVWDNEELLNITGMYDIRRRDGCEFLVEHLPQAESYRAELDCDACLPNTGTKDSPRVLNISREGISVELCDGASMDFTRLTGIDESRPTP